MRVFIGHDEREAEAAEVAAKSLRKVTHGEIEPEFLCMPKLVAQGLLSQRVVDQRDGQDYDLASNAPQSTRFAISRFLTPVICQNGLALFVDADVVFLEDPRNMLWGVTAEHAVGVVQHSQGTVTPYKMVNQVQTSYARKNWSSVMLFNCDHAANRRLSLRDINERPGRDLHAFYWLHDHELGNLARCWNWLVNVEPKPDNGVGVAHFTLGGPWLEGWKGAPHDDMWLAARDAL